MLFLKRFFLSIFKKIFSAFPCYFMYFLLFYRVTKFKLSLSPMFIEYYFIHRLFTSTKCSTFFFFNQRIFMIKATMSTQITVASIGFARKTCFSVILGALSFLLFLLTYILSVTMCRLALFNNSSVVLRNGNNNNDIPTSKKNYARTLTPAHRNE